LEKMQKAFSQIFNQKLLQQLNNKSKNIVEITLIEILSLVFFQIFQNIHNMQSIPIE